MAWTKNRKMVLNDLRYVPRERCGWDCTLAALAFAARATIGDAQPDLAEWAARHGLPAGARPRDIGPSALTLWHGTSRPRADKIAEHGLFHKKGLWTTTDPTIAHGYTRGRAERFGAEGAMVCLVVDLDEMVEGQDYQVEANSNILRFHHGLPPELVEYVMVRETIRFEGESPARRASPWPRARFKRLSGQWVPVRQTPVRYSDSESYSTPLEFARICVDRLLGESGELAAIEVFSTLYALVEPWDALEHQEILNLIETTCTVNTRRRGKWQTLRARACDEVLC